jgi:hypothetical protein
MAFQPGQSGNPGGRPKDVGHVRDLARQHTEAAVLALVEALSAKSERTRVAAAEALLDRGWGKAVQQLEHTGAEGAPLSLTVTFVKPGDG